MTRFQTKQAQNLIDACACAALDYETAIWVVASWMKRQGIPINQRNLDRAISHLT